MLRRSIASGALTLACALVPRVASAEPPSPGEPPTSSTATPPRGGTPLLITSGALTGLGWVSRFIGIGLGMRYPGFCTFGACSDPSRSTAWRVFNYAPAVTQFVATGFAIPGGMEAGELDGWRASARLTRPRDARAFVVAGAVLFGVFTATSIALRPAVLLPCFSGTGGCEGPGSYVAYSLAAQTSDTLSTVGAGLLSYGVAYRRASQEYSGRLTLGAWSHAGGHGVLLRGRF